jgi:DNA-binding transcriptional ArsR family regulator
MARAATTADVFNAVAERRRRDLLDALHDGDATVGELVDRLDLPQPVVSKHLKVLRDVDLVRPRTIGRTRVYTLNDAALAPLHDWLARYERAVNERLDRLDDYLAELQHDRPARDQHARDGGPT